MALSAPTNCWTHAHRAIAESVAAAPAFVSLLESVGLTAADAPSRVFGERVGLPVTGDVYTPGELETLRAFAHVMNPPDQPYGKRRRTHGLWDPVGRAIVTVQRLIDRDTLTADQARGVEGSADAPTAIEWEFQQRGGELIDQLIAALVDEQDIHPTAVDVTQAPGFTHEKLQSSQGAWQGFELAVTWGLGGR